MLGGVPSTATPPSKDADLTPSAVHSESESS